MDFLLQVVIFFFYAAFLELRLYRWMKVQEKALIVVGKKVGLPHTYKEEKE